MLTQSLNRIMNWLQLYTPEFAASFEAGLTRQEIQNVIEVFNLQLPEEFCELYHWRNGTISQPEALFSPSLNFSPLSNALQNTEWMMDADFAEEESLLFPFMFYEGEYYAAVLSHGNKLHAPIVWIAQHDDKLIPYSENLTSMMLTLAECYETGAYYLNSSGELERNSKESARILRKNNPNICTRALSITKELLSLETNFSFNMLSCLAREMKVLEIYQPPDAVEPLLQALEVWRQSRSIEGVSVRSAIVQTLRALSDPQISNSLVDVLKHDEVGGIRQYAAQGLGDVENSGAISLLIESLASTDSSVRTGASGALFKLQAIDPVIEALPSLGSYGRESAAWLLARFGDPKAIEPLSTLLQDSSYSVREAARKAISILQRRSHR